MRLRSIAVAVLFVAGAAAQSVEIGGGLGDANYRNPTVTGSTGTATAGYRNSWFPSIVITDNMWEHVSGEFRYMYQTGKPFISMNGTSATMPGKTHTFLYDTLIHVYGREKRIRPYAAAGVGVKGYTTPGPAPTEPFPKVVALMANSSWKPVFSLGGGVKVGVLPHVLLRFDLRDYITPVPKTQLVPGSSATLHGMLQQVTPMVGVGFTF